LEILIMNKLIREDIERIKSLMLESEGKTEYNFCDRFSGNKQKMYVCSKIGSLKGFLSRSNGLDLKTVIEKQISDLETEIPKDLQKKFIDGAIFLESLGKITEDKKNDFIENNVINNKLVYLNGEWQPINKLNTNYYDLAELLTELIYKNKNNTTFQAIIKDPKTTLMRMKSELKKMIEDYFDDPMMLFDYTKNIQRTTQQGIIIADPFTIYDNKTKETIQL